MKILLTEAFLRDLKNSLAKFSVQKRTTYFTAVQRSLRSKEPVYSYSVLKPSDSQGDNLHHITNLPCSTTSFSLSSDVDTTTGGAD